MVSAAYPPHLERKVMSFPAFLGEGQREAQHHVGAGLHPPRSPLPCTVLPTESGIWDPYTSVPRAGDTTWPQATLCPWLQASAAPLTTPSNYALRSRISGCSTPDSPSRAEEQRELAQSQHCGHTLIL